MKILKNNPLAVLFALFFVSIVLLLMNGPIPQPQVYHKFADHHAYFGIPNFWNVVSNVPFLFVGIPGLIFACKTWKFRPDKTSRLIPVVFFAGVSTAFFGSAYYHWDPDNSTLWWDRLPMVFMFMSIFSLLIYDFIGAETGAKLFPVLLFLGVFSLFHWHYTESIGKGDLRIYGMVQFFPMAVVPFIIWLFPKDVNYIKHILMVLFIYSLSKGCEHFDHEIFNLTGFIGGHPIKHFLGAVAMFWAFLLMKEWQAKWIGSDVGFKRFL